MKDHRWHLGCVTATMLVTGLLIQMGSPVFAQKHPEREAYFGETHVHTSWSLDSYLGFGNTIAGPEEFYKYSLGQPVTHPGGFTVKITRPLDWGATTEHAEYLGAVQAALDPNSELSKTLIGKSLKFGNRVDSTIISGVSGRSCTFDGTEALSQAAKSMGSGSFPF